MQHVGRHVVVGVVQQVDLHLAGLALLHIVELHVVHRREQPLHVVGVAVRVVNEVFHHHALHLQADGLVGGVGVDDGLLVEVSQHACVVGQRYGEALSGSHGSRPVDSGAAAVGVHAADDELLRALVPQFEGGGDGHLIACLTHVDGSLVDDQFLRPCGAE